VLEAIMEAGGFAAYADPKKVSLIRQVQGDHHSQIVDLSPVLKGMPAPVMYISRRHDLPSSKVHQFLMKTGMRTNLRGERITVVRAF
jgi:hypothetical protein